MNAPAHAPTIARILEPVAAARPTAAALERDYGALRSQANIAHSGAELHVLFTAWETVRRAFASWKAFAELRFRQDTSDTQAQGDADALAALAVIAEHNDAEIKRRLVTSEHRPDLERTLGRYLFERWENDLRAFDVALGDDLVEESQLVNRYTELVAGARIAFRGKERTLAGLAAFTEDADRATRRAAVEATWSVFAAHADELDGLFDDLVRRRAAMASTLGQRSYTELAYRRLGRTDYGVADVARFRAEIRTEIVPLAAEITRRQAESLGIAVVMPWDEQVLDRAGPLRAPASASAVLSAVGHAFASMHPRLGAFVERVVDDALFDLDLRGGKAGGAFCTFFPTLGLPFIFANLDGTSRTVASVVHELGHAFQDYSARGKAALEYFMPTAEAGEIHSLSLELLAYPHYDRVFGAGAARFRRQHLSMLLLMLPYIAAIDEFQELVYTDPNVSADDRRAIWLDLERKYLPHRDAGDIPHLMRGGRWQRQRHVYAFPFYYIDYGLALCCALQLWSRSLDDHAAAMESYVALCDRGGEFPFRQLVQSAGLQSPFEPGALAAVAHLAHAFLKEEPVL